MKLVGNCEMQAIEANADHDTTPFYVVEVEQALATLQTDGKLGLRSDQAQERLAQFGPNELPQEPPVPLWRKLFRQFNELVIWLLVVAAFVSGVMSD
ncbi:MAG TPA: cation-transporting P-type ATPase, partial [Pirellulales bacterium]|nr:cation-transporting P-type ATPase [Pirellulales bacterium]